MTEQSFSEEKGDLIFLQDQQRLENSKKGFLKTNGVKKSKVARGSNSK